MNLQLSRTAVVLTASILTFAVCTRLAGNVLADSVPASEISRSLKSVFPNVEITRISESSIPGLYEVVVGSEVLYVSRDGRYLVDGDILDLRERLNLSEVKRAAARVKALAGVPDGEMIEFAPEHAEHTIYVFTDISCSFCRMLHRDVDELNRRGIAVRYLAFPRTGMDTPVSRKMESVWCAPDRRKALTDAKSDLPVKESRCDNPVAKHFALGQAMGVTGTPGIYSENGQHLPGYLPPEEMLKILKEN